MSKLLTGLRTEIVLNVALLMIAATALSGFVVLKVSEQAALDQKVKSAKVILNSIQNSMKYFELSRNQENIEGIQRFIDMVFESGDLDTIVLSDRNMRVIAHSSHDAVGQIYSDDALLEGIRERRVTTQIHGKTVSVAGPLYLGNEIMGGVKIILSSRDVIEAAAKSQRLILFYVILNSLTLIVFGSVLLSRTIVRPIDELVAVTDAVAGGDLNQHIKVRRLNEIGMLAESFNRMTNRIREGKEELEASIKHLKTAQDEVIRAEKLATVGRLAAGIAHEIGNPLSSIVGYTDIIQKGACKEDEEEYLSRIQAETQRINRIVTGLLDYARAREFELVWINLNDTLESSLDLVSVRKGFEKINIKIDLNDVPMVMADAHQLQQVLINLFINAADAMPDGGSLVVRSGVRSHEILEFVEISVTDTGTGMGDDERRKIFDPFYTTKEPGKGTGLGLSICMRIIESFGGRIEVTSNKGAGSTFSILLPVKGSG